MECCEFHGEYGIVQQGPHLSSCTSLVAFSVTEREQEGGRSAESGTLLVALKSRHGFTCGELSSGLLPSASVSKHSWQSSLLPSEAGSVPDT